MRDAVSTEVENKSCSISAQKCGCVVRGLGQKSLAVAAVFIKVGLSTFLGQVRARARQLEASTVMEWHENTKYQTGFKEDTDCPVPMSLNGFQFGASFKNVSRLIIINLIKFIPIISVKNEK